MVKEKLTASSLTEYIQLVSEYEKRWSSSGDYAGLWYRGQQRKHWNLQPKFYRELDNPTPEDEDDIREEFVIRAPSLTDEKPQNAWEWYFLMQHYGTPTRLLDWTDGALIGLYFAVRDNLGYYDAAVWLLDPWWLNGLFMGKQEVLPPGSAGLSKKDAERYRPWLRDRFQSRARLPKWPVAIFPTHFARRISTQRSCFTVHGRYREALDYLSERPKARLTRIVIPSHAVENIKESLSTSGIDEVTIFPDLEGLGRAIRGGWRSSDQKAPHEGVNTRLGRSKLDKDGVGVFAIRNIRKGKMIFPGETDEMVWIEAKSLSKLPPKVRKLYEDFAVEKDGRYLCPVTFDRLTPSWYLNDSEDPNVRGDENYDFFAARPIATGEELSVDSRTYSEHKTFKLRKSKSNRRKGRT